MDDNISLCNGTSVFDKAFVLFHQVFLTMMIGCLTIVQIQLSVFTGNIFLFMLLLIVTISVSTLTTIHHLFNKEERTL